MIKLTFETSRLFNFLCELKLYCKSYLPKMVVANHPRILGYIFALVILSPLMLPAMTLFDSS